MQEEHQQMPAPELIEQARYFKWAISARCRIQEFMLDLYCFRKRPRYNELTEMQGVYDLLVGSAFSLWRAAFLADYTRVQPTVADRANELLKKLLEDNTFGFAQDRGLIHWTGGYYLNNASFRLYQIITDAKKSECPWNELKCDLESCAAIRAALPEMKNIQSSQAPVDGNPKSPEELWELLYKAQVAVFQTFSRFRSGG